jgi:hypothetical protein
MTKAAGPRPVKPWRHPRLSVDEITSALLAAITIEEKVAQPDSHWVFHHPMGGAGLPGRRCGHLSSSQLAEWSSR